MQTVRQPLESHLSRQIRGLDAAGQRALALSQLQELGSKYSPDVVELLRSVLSRADNEATLSGWLATLPATRNAAYLKALLASDLDWPSAAHEWQTYFAQQPDRDPADLLHYARALADTERYTEAADQLLRALHASPPYAFFTRAEKLIARIAGRTPPTLRNARIAILGNSTTGFLVPVLKALCLRDRITAEFYEGAYGSQRQEILDPDGALARFQPDIVILPASWRDVHFPATGWAAEQADLWRQLAARFPCHVIQYALDYPLHESYGLLGNTLPDGRTRAIETLNRELFDHAPAFVSILDTPELQRAPGSTWEDAQQWFSYQQHPASSVLPAVAEALMAHVRAVLGLARKVLVVDLDNTLWKGVIGEDGLKGIQVGPGTPAGEAHQQLQHYVRELKDRGVLLAVCSKNNPDDARLPFEKHPGMALRLDDFAAFHANWDDKATNIRRIAAELSLGLDSFVFLDDNPLEREWVRSQIPELTVVDLGPNVFHYLRDLDRGRYFYTLALSAEDSARAGQYRTQAARETLRSTYSSMDEFLSQLKLEASAEPVTAANLARVTQLVNKTNQFNVTTRRYTEAQISHAARDSQGWAAAFQMADRFGSYGLIGVMICRAGASASEWEIDSWLMSCRTLGREMEKFMFDRLREAAFSRGVSRLIGVYRPTPKNNLVATLFHQLGFTKTSETAEEIRYELGIPEPPAITATHVRNALVEQLVQV